MFKKGLISMKYFSMQHQTYVIKCSGLNNIQLRSTINTRLSTSAITERSIMQPRYDSYTNHK